MDTGIQEMTDLERATEAFLKGSQMLVSNGVSLGTIVNALISAIITIGYAAGEDPAELSLCLRRAAGEIPLLFREQDKKRN